MFERNKPSAGGVERRFGGVGEGRDRTDRPAAEVLRDHLDLRMERALEADLRRNYDSEVLVVTSKGTARGHDAIRTTAAILQDHCGDRPYEYLLEMVEGDLAYLVWQVRADGLWIHGADSFQISGGKIRIQTIHYLVLTRAVE